MGFTIYTTALDKKTFTGYKEARLFEAFCIGMRIDYSLIYPNGNVKDVEFKENEMTTITELDQKIDRLQQQMKCLSEDKNISDKDRCELRRYYEDKLNSYTAQKKALIKNIDVTADVLDPEEKQVRETP